MSSRAAGVLTAGSLLAAVVIIPLGAATVSASASASVAAEECTPEGAALKVRKGSDARDPNALSAAAVGAAEKDFATRQFAASSARSTTTTPLAALSSVTVPVYVHVITSSSGAGAVPTSRIDSQIAVLNAAYASTGFSFQLAATDVTANDAWYTTTNGTTAERQMKKT